MRIPFWSKMRFAALVVAAAILCIAAAAAETDNADAAESSASESAAPVVDDESALEFEQGIEDWFHDMDVDKDQHISFEEYRAYFLNDKVEGGGAVRRKPLTRCACSH